MNGFFSNAQCVNFPANSPSTILSYSFVGGSFQSYGCAPIDPTFWIAGNGISVTITFVNPQQYPTFRVWGMNNDDVASVLVNNLSYSLNASSAFYSPKVVCGISPGPDGVLFSGGNLVGSNTNAQGNFSYSDIQLNATNVTSIKVTGISGAGWGFASVLVNCPNLNTSQFELDNTISIYPNPTSGNFNIEVNNELIGSNVSIYNILGQKIKDFTLDFITTTQNLNNGIYLLEIEKDGNKTSKKLIVN